MKQPLSRALLSFREHGVGTTLRRLFERVMRRVVAAVYQERVEVILTKDLSDPIPDDVVIPFVLDALGGADIEALRQFIRTHNVDPITADQRLAFSLQRGFSGLVAKQDGHIIGYGWYTEGARPHPQMRLHDLPMNQNEVFAFDLFLAPAIRNKHAGLAFLVAAQGHMLNLHCRRAYNSVLAANRRSLWVHHQAGWKEVDRRTVRILFSTVLMCHRRIQRYDRRWF